MKKFVYGLLLAAITIICSSCTQNPGGGYNRIVPTISGVENGATDVDPTIVKKIELKFPVAMDRNYTDYVYTYMNNQPEDLCRDLISSGWKNDYTYEFEVLLAYGKEYKVTINYKGTDVKGYDSNVFFRDQNGNLAEEFVINFNTMERPKRSPIEKTVNLEIPKFQSVFNLKFAENNAAQNTQSYILDLRNIGIYEIQKGDKITINYNISSVYDLKNIKAQLADISKEANYWLKLDKNKDEIFVEDLPANTKYNGSITFEIENSSVRIPAIQFYCDYEENPENVQIDFFPVE